MVTTLRHVLGDVADDRFVTDPRPVVIGVLAEADERVLTGKVGQYPFLRRIAHDLHRELGHEPLQRPVRARLAARPPDDPLVLDLLPLAAYPPFREMVDDDCVGPVNDVVVQSRLGPVDVGTGFAVGRPDLVAQADEVRIGRNLRRPARTRCRLPRRC